MERRWVAMVVLPLDEMPLRPRMRELGTEGGEKDEGGVSMCW